MNFVLLLPSSFSFASFVFWRAIQSKGLDELLCDRPALFMFGIVAWPFSVLNLILEPKLTLGQFLDFVSA